MDWLFIGSVIALLGGLWIISQILKRHQLDTLCTLLKIKAVQEELKISGAGKEVIDKLIESNIKNLATYVKQ